MSFRKSILVATCLLLPVPAIAGEESVNSPPANSPLVNYPSGSGSTSKEEPIKVSIRAKAACMPDAVRLCRDALPNVRGVLMCFDQHREQISNRCRTVLASYGLQ